MWQFSGKEITQLLKSKGLRAIRTSSETIFGQRLFWFSIMSLSLVWVDEGQRWSVCRPWTFSLGSWSTSKKLSVCFVWAVVRAISILWSPQSVYLCRCSQTRWVLPKPSKSRRARVLHSGNAPDYTGNLMGLQGPDLSGCSFLQTFSMGFFYKLLGDWFLPIQLE